MDSPTGYPSGSNGSDPDSRSGRSGRPCPPIPVSSVLLVHPDADRWLEGVTLSTAGVMTAATAKEARAFIAGTAIETVLIGPGVEGAEAIAALCDVLGLSTRVENVAGPDALAEHLGAAAANAGDPVEALRYLKGELGRVAHSLNNPLAVITGNAQLGLEVARATNADATVTEALEAVGEAAAELEALFSDIGQMRGRVGQALGQESSG